jgi:patatin-like phospholipase/acyl hydrolase
VSEDGKNPKLKLSDILDVYVLHGNEIFPIKSKLGSIIGEVTKLNRPAYKADGLSNVLNNMLGKATIMNCMKPILVCSYDMRYDEPLFFKSRRASVPENNENALLFDVCRATSAGPTYLPAYDFKFGGKDRICVDGGVFINNPSVAAYTEIDKFYNDPFYNLTGYSPNDICMLSLGTGHFQDDYAKKNPENWGELQWVKPVSDVMMQGVNQANDYVAAQLVSDNQYLRLNINIDKVEHADMADASDATRKYLLETTKAYIAQVDTQQKINAFLTACELPILVA